MANEASILSDESAQRSFWERVAKGDPDQCWEWQAGRNARDYGIFCRGRDRLMAHRVALSLATGETPAGMKALHGCDNPPCCNPKHLRWGTTQENRDDRSVRSRGSVRPICRHSLAVA